MKKTNLIAITLLIALFASLVGCSSPPSTLILKDVGPTLNFTVIEITNSVGDIKNCGVIGTDEVLSTIWEIKFSRDVRFRNQYDVLYQIKFLAGSSERKTMYILGDDSIVYDGYIYKALDDSIDLDYLATIFE